MQVRAEGIELLPILLEQYTSWSIVRFVQTMLMKSLLHTEELRSCRVLLEHNPGVQPSVCFGLDKEQA